MKELITIEESRDIIIASLFSDITLNKIDKITETSIYTKSVKNTGNMFIGQLDKIILDMFDDAQVLDQFIFVKKRLMEKLDTIIEEQSEEILKVLNNGK